MAKICPKEKGTLLLKDCPIAFLIFGFLFLAATCSKKVDLCLIIDNSGSIRDANPPDNSYDNWELQLEFASLLAGAFDIGPDATQVGAVEFSSSAKLVFSLDTYNSKQDVKNAIKSISYAGATTNTDSGMALARTDCFGGNGDRPTVANIAILITDDEPFGDGPDERASAIEESQNLKDTGALLLVISPSAAIDKTYLEELSSPPKLEDKTYFVTSSFTSLVDVVQGVVENTCENIPVGTGRKYFCRQTSA